MQTGNVTSAAPQIVSQVLVPANNWVVDFTFTQDNGSTATAQAIVGSGPGATVGFWSTPNATVSVTAAGYTGNILLNCPDIIKFCAFGQRIKGFPFA